jgi:hypothetical protein
VTPCGSRDTSGVPRPRTLRAGDIDGDIQMLLGIPMPYETRAHGATTCPVLERGAFEGSFSYGKVRILDAAGLMRLAARH